MKALYMIDSLRAGGKERQAVSLLKGLAQRGVEILVVCMGEDHFFGPSLRETTIRLEHLLRRRRWDPVAFIRLHHLVQGFRPDVLHTTCWMTSFYALPVGKIHRIPVVNGSIRNAFTRGGIRWKVERMLLKLSDARVANSRAGFNSRRFRATDPGNYVIYNGFDFSRLSPTEPQILQKMLDLSQGKRIVGMVAEFREDKDYATYFEAARLILRKRSDVCFVAVGGGKNLEVLRQRYGIDNSGIQFLGRQTAVESIVSTFEIGVLATYTEGISNAIMEYMALGKPVVSTDGGGTTELVINGVTGFVVPPQQPKALAERIELLLERPELSTVFGKAAQQRIRTRFSIQQLVDTTLQSYRSVLRPAFCGESVAVSGSMRARAQARTSRPFPSRGDSEERSNRTEVY